MNLSPGRYIPRGRKKLTVTGQKIHFMAAEACRALGLKSSSAYFRKIP